MAARTSWHDGWIWSEITSLSPYFTLIGWSETSWFSSHVFQCRYSHFSSVFVWYKAFTICSSAVWTCWHILFCWQYPNKAEKVTVKLLGKIRRWFTIVQEMGRLQKMLHVGAKMPGCCFLMIRISSVCKLQLVLSVPTSWNFSVLSAFCYANESSLFWTPCVIVPLLCTVYALW